jgi:signal transduction histidine kinase
VTGGFVYGKVRRVRRPTTPPRRDILLAVVLMVLALAEVFANGLTPYAASVPLTVIQTGAVGWWRRAPLPALIVATAAMFAQTAAGVSLHTPLAPIVIALVLVYAVAQHEPLGRALTGLVVALCGSLGAIELAIANGEDYDIPDRLFVSLFIVAPWLVGRAVHRRTHEVEVLAERAGRLEGERQAALDAERRRIARELHDVIAHSLSVIVVQAGAGETVAARRPEQALATLHSIQQIGRQALTEMSRVVGVLREGGPEIGLAPQPGLDELTSLLAQMRDAGLDVELRIDGSPFAVAPGLDLAAYRIVQEALTNARKHAGNAKVTVTLTYAPGDLTIDVVDDGAGSDDGWGGGHGLIGMRERTAVYGGTFDAGPRDTGGFAVRVGLPVEAATT